jgi:hypothetical protein
MEAGCVDRKGFVANICRFESVGQKSELFRTVSLQHRFAKMMFGSVTKPLQLKNSTPLFLRLAFAPASA